MHHHHLSLLHRSGWLCWGAPVQPQLCQVPDWLFRHRRDGNRKTYHIIMKSEHWNEFLEVFRKPVRFWSDLFSVLGGWTASPIKYKNGWELEAGKVAKSIKKCTEFRIFATLGMGRFMEHYLGLRHPYDPYAKANVSQSQKKTWRIVPGINSENHWVQSPTVAFKPL